MTSSSASSATGAPIRASGPGRLATTVLGLVAALLVAGGWVLPLWQATLHAPQYPGGLTTVAYGHQVTGDLNEINALNHYVGLGVFDPSDVPEMRLWPVALAVALVAVAVALLTRGRWTRRLALLYLWVLPFGVLAAIQFRLHEFGQAVAPGAAFRMEPFTPWVVGPTTVWNFETWSRPGLGLLAILAAALVVTIGPRRLTRTAAPPDRGRPAAAAGLVGVLLVSGTLGLAAPAEAQSHDHSGHEQGTDGGQVQDGSARHQGPHDGTDQREGATPDIGPSEHSAMPTVTEHPVVGGLADLIDATEPGGTLVLPAGTYTGPVVIDQPIVIEGDGLPIVEGDGTGSVITVRAPGTQIRGLVVRGSGPGPSGDPAGIRVEADDVTIEGVVVQDSYMGIAVDSAAAVKLLDNHLHGRLDAGIVDEGHAVAADHDGDDVEATDGHDGHDGHAADDHGAGHGGDDEHAGHGVSRVANASRGDGIWLHDVDHVLVRGNHIAQTRDGVFVSFGSGAVIDSNHVHGSRYAVHSMFADQMSVVQNHFADNLSGAVLMYGGEVLLLRNHVEGSSSPSTGFGVVLKDVVGVEAVQNVLVDNRIGLHIDGPTETSGEASFVANTIARNAVGAQLLSSARASFAGNSFASNAIQVLSLGRQLSDVTWAADGWGNYWSTYRGYDALGQGRGAVAHTEGGTVDRLLGRNPELLAIADSPAMRLLRSVEERWGQRDPVLTDELPLTRPLSPALAVEPSEPTARAVAVLLGGTLLLPALITFVRRPRRVAARARRFPRAVSV